MARLQRTRQLVLTSLLVLVLAACETSEERAERHFQSGMALLEEGDTQRALIEFRNVFKLNPEHLEARLAFARTRLDQGAKGAAYNAYLRITEQAPDMVEPLLVLSEIAIETQNWEEAQRHGRKVLELAPDDPRAQVIAIALDYAEGHREQNPILVAQAADRAEAVLETAPENLIARRVYLDSVLRNSQFDTALAVLDDGLTYHPDDYELNSTKLQLLLRARDIDAVGDTLKTMVERFPENTEIQQMMIAWYVEQKDMTGAEAFLRQLAAKPDADPNADMLVVRFLLETQGRDAGRAEISRLIEEGTDQPKYRSLLATLDFEDGAIDKAIADLEALVSEDLTTEDMVKSKVLLAQMLERSDNSLGARARVEEVLAEDPGNVAALKMRAQWRISDDEPDNAIIDLRTALAQEPRDPEILTLMAIAHERAGSRDLAGERYALAVEVSDRAPDESLRYVNFLVQDDRIDSAKAVLTEALERSPSNIDLLRNLAALHLQGKNWNDVTRIIWKLRALETNAATSAANGIEAELLLRQERVDETIAFLESVVAQSGDNPDAAIAALVQTKVRAGQIDEATDLVDRRLEADPDNPALLYVRAGLHLIASEREEAAGMYADLLELSPGNGRVLRTLNAILVAEGRQDEATALIEDQIEKAQDPRAALLLKAERLELDRDFDGAIAVYERLYEMDNNNILIANNLASLITTHRDSAEDLDKAYSIARRLRSSDIPALQDTYGWIAYRRGNYEEALTYLESAAAGLPEHALVHYHLGMTYTALDRKEDAIRTLKKAISLGSEEPLPQFDKAREVLEGLGG